jgi:hypothetical protein
MTGAGGRFAELTGALEGEQRLHFYEVFAHNLTVVTRAIWSDGSLPPEEMVERMKWVNEVLHAATAKVWALRLNTREWSEGDFGALVAHYVGVCPALAGDLSAAVSMAYESVTGRRSDGTR